MEHNLVFPTYEEIHEKSVKLAELIKDKNNNGVYPSFVEPYGKKQDLFAVYVGPFHTEDDIVDNIDMIQTLSE